MDTLGSPSVPLQWILSRWLGVAFGIGTQLLFLFTVVYLFLFLRFGSTRHHETWWLLDLILAIGFCLPHSLLFTPTMTLDHAILTTVWTVYIFAGSYFKDRRLIRFIGQPYLEYGRRVPGLPMIGFGSLRRFKADSLDRTDNAKP